MKHAIICDIDGTFTNPNRLGHLEETTEWCSAILRAFGKKVQIIFVTDRSERSRYVIEKWIENRMQLMGHGALLFMRPGLSREEQEVGEGRAEIIEDHRPEAYIKSNIYDEHIRDKYNVLFVLEDDHVCARMYRMQGLTVLLCE